MNREFARQLRIDVLDALKDVAAKHGVTMEVVGTVTYGGDNVQMKIRATSNDPTTGAARDSKETDFKQYASLYGMKPDDYGKLVQIAGETMTIAGIAPKSYKFPVLLQNSRGKMYKYPADVVKRALGAPTGTAFERKRGL